MKNSKIFHWLLLCFVVLFSLSNFISCTPKRNIEKWRHVEIQPIDGSQSVTVITRGDKRYIINGKQDEIPDDGYLLLDISKVDRLGDAISICWNDGGYKWKIASAYAELIENKMDTSNFLYYQPLGEFGEPVSLGYTGENCGGTLIREDSKPRGNFIIKYKP